LDEVVHGQVMKCTTVGMRTSVRLIPSLPLSHPMGPTAVESIQVVPSTWIAMPRLAAPYYPEETPQSLFALAKDHPHGSTKRLFFAASVVGLSCWPQLLALGRGIEGIQSSHSFFGAS